MKTKIEITSVSGQLLFEYEKEENTVKDTLMKAIESGADLRCADLRSAYLYGANLHGADLRCANLRDADLRSAYLCGANLYGANLHGANLYGADLRDTNLRDANLCNADLYGADLYGANLYGADLYGAYLRSAYLSGAKDIPFVPTYLPKGEFIGWKKLLNGIIAKLKILEDSKRSRANGDKCRCDKALVLEFQNIDSTPSNEKEYTSNVYAKCTYKVGEIVYADSWDDNRWNECSHGIHFFIDRQSAVNY